MCISPPLNVLATDKGERHVITGAIDRLIDQHQSKQPSILILVGCALHINNKSVDEIAAKMSKLQ